MTELGFELLGHDNPLGRYPAPVVPIGRLMDELVAVYAGTDGRQVVKVADGDVFIRHEDFLAAKLKAFDYRHDRLFALDAQEVNSYHAIEEQEYFGQLLRDSDFSKSNPFLRLSLAKAIAEPEVLINELYGCVANLSHFADGEFIDHWYKLERENLLHKIDASHHLRLPATWYVLLGIQQARKPDVFRPPQGFFRQSSSQDVGRGAAGAAMGAALMVVTMFHTRESAEYAYRLLLERNYDQTDVSLLLLQRTFANLFPELQAERYVIEHDIDQKSLARVLIDRAYADLGSLRIVCAGPFAKNLGSVTKAGGTAGLIAELATSGLSANQALIYEAGIRHGGILMGVSSVPDSEAWYFENEWLGKMK